MIDVNYVLETVMGYSYTSFDMTDEDEIVKYDLLYKIANMIIKDGYDVRGF